MITITPLGPNSATLTYDNTTLLIDLIQEVEDYITTHGWSLWDINAGTNARAYRSLKQDGVKYNYIVLDWNTSGYVILRTYESWDEVAHSGLNKAANTYRHEDMPPQLFPGADNFCDLEIVTEIELQQPVDLANGGTIHLYSQSTYLVIFGITLAKTGTAKNSPTVFCEYARDNIEDASAKIIPSHGILNADNMIGGWLTDSGYGGIQTKSDSIPAGYVFSFCRLLNGNTGEAATKHSWFALPEMFWCSPKSWFQNGEYSHVNRFGRTTDWDPILSGENAWSGKKLCSNIFVGYSGGVKETSLYIPNGRLYNLKIISSNQGALNDIARIEVDGAGFFSVGGTLTDHLIIPLRNWGVNFPYRLRMAIPA